MIVQLHLAMPYIWSTKKCQQNHTHSNPKRNGTNMSQQLIQHNLLNQDLGHLN